MSLRSYLFALIGGLILLFTLSQLVLLYWLEQNITSDINHKVRVINERALKLALDNVNLDTEHTFVFKTNNDKSHGKTNVSPPKVIVDKNFEVYAFTTNENSPITKFRKVEQLPSNNQNQNQNSEQQHLAPEVSRQIIQKAFSTQLKRILHDNELNTTTNLVIENDKVTQQWITETSPVKSSSVRLIESIQYSLILSAIVALMFAYWLSIQFNKPLKQLSNGFKKLANGDYKHQVKAQGVKEIRATIKHYNNMVTKLDELTLIQQQHQEIAHLAELGEVSRGLAHALRNPIHTIGLSIEQLQDEALDDKLRQQLLTTVQHKIANIDKSIKALLTLTTTGINRQENIPVLAVVQDIILECKSGYKSDITFEVDIDKSLTIVGAESEIRNILHTLIINACEASESQNQVEIKALQHNEQISVLVKDHGCGLEKNIKDKLFQPHISSKPEGAGMGLYIAKRLISLHYNGNIQIENNNNDKAQGCLAQATFATNNQH